VTDRQTDGRAIAYTRYSIYMYAVARKKHNVVVNVGIWDELQYVVGSAGKPFHAFMTLSAKQNLIILALAHTYKLHKAT